MTTARKRRAKAARNALQAACRVSGVVIAAAPSRGCSEAAAAKETVAEVLAPALLRRLALMGWPDTAENRKRARDQRMGSLPGRLDLARLLDADGLEYRATLSADALDRAYGRVVLGVDVPMDGDRSAWGATDAERIRTLTDHWMALQGVLGSVRKSDRQDSAGGAGACRAFRGVRNPLTPCAIRDKRNVDDHEARARMTPRRAFPFRRLAWRPSS
jgi:hypothetical protein